MNTSGRSTQVNDVKVIEADNNKKFSELLKTALNEGYTLAEGGPQVTSFFGLFTSWQAVVIRYERDRLSKSHFERTLLNENTGSSIVGP